MILHNHFDTNEKGHLTVGGMDAVELAKKYGADASSGFINGVLAKLVEA